MTNVQAAPSILTYQGPKEVLIKTPVTLNGTFNPNQVAKVVLIAEDKYPFNVVSDSTAGTWKVQLNEGFYNAGARWLRLRGFDRNGKVVNEKIINLSISNEPMTVGQDLTLKILTDTLFKASPRDSSALNAQQKAVVKAGQTFKATKYGLVDGHLKVELATPIDPVGTFGYFYTKHANLIKGQKVLKFDIADVPTVIPGAAQMLVVKNTLIKAKPEDSSTLAANQKAELTLGQAFELTGYACLAGHFRVTFVKDLPGFGSTGYIYWEHIQIKKDGKEVTFDPDALSVTALKSTVFKKRPVDSNNLKDEEKYNFPAKMVYGVAGYAPADGHVKVALTDNLPGFGNTGYVFSDVVQFKRGSQVIDLTPSQVELNVPYFSQRDNPRWPGSTCNVTSIAMVLYYYGLRSKSGGQLEDELLQWCINRYGAGSETDHSVLAQMVRAYGFQDDYGTNRTWGQIRNELASGRPVVIAGYFTHSGHIVCVIGYTPTGYIVNDPWGDAQSGYWSTEGRKVFYPSSYMAKMCSPEGEGNAWAHFISR
jgi:uncharacterized protein YvpB